MKILRLRLAGFGPYKSEELVDFERFDADGIFLIAGKTGAGKSSILDAICFALYNQVPRFDGGELTLRSDHCEPNDPTFVELDFSVNDARYRLRRSPAYERPKIGRTGVTKAAPTAVLQVLDGNDWRGIAAKPVTVGHELSAILPLRVDQFLQVILLAQNRFQRFLLAKTEERRMVLRSLFNTGRFDQLEAALIVRRKGFDEQLMAGQRDLDENRAAAMALLQRDGLPGEPGAAAGVSGVPGAEWFAAGHHDLETQRDAAAALVALGDTRLAEATELHASLVHLRERQLRRATATGELATLEDAQIDSTRERADLSAAERAARVWPQIRSAREAALALEAALSALGAVRAERRHSRGPAEPADGAGDGDAAAEPEALALVEGDIDGLLGRLGALDDALTDERTLPRLDAEIVELIAAQNERTGALAAALADLEKLPRQIEAAAAEHSASLVLAARQDDTTIALDRAARHLEAAETVERLGVMLLDAQHQELTASGDNAAAAAHYEAVLARRFSGFAAELATRLITGDACFVCGATVHPQPARGEHQPVTRQDLDAARAEVAERQGELQTAQTAVQSVDLRLAEAHAVTLGNDLTALLAAHEAASTAHELAGRAARLLPALLAKLTALRSATGEATSNLDVIRAGRDRAVVACTARVSLRQSIVDRLTVQRGEFDSVQAHAAQLETRLVLARALAVALVTVGQRSAERAATRSQLLAQLADAGFATVEEVHSARRDPIEIEQRMRALREHDDALTAVRAALAHPDLAELPIEIADCEPARLAVAAANSVRDTALTRHGSLVERTVAFEVINGRVAALLEESGAVQLAYQQVRALADVVRGDEPNTKRMRLENYVLAAQLEQIVEAANTRLRTMTSGRYALEHDDSLAFGGARSGLGLVIRDEYTGRARATHSLSGGETFLASLALALGLAEVVTAQAGGITLDTLFVDEGFGSLDGDTLETAMSTLDTLRAGGRTIGLISHVDSMKEQIPATLRVWVTDQGYSRIAPDMAGTAVDSGDPP